MWRGGGIQLMSKLKREELPGFTNGFNYTFFVLLAWDKEAVTTELLQSGMHTSGQLNTDLALSESDEDEDEDLQTAKRPRMDDFQSSL
jgi:hypothetical protein